MSHFNEHAKEIKSQASSLYESAKENVAEALAIYVPNYLNN